MKNVPNGLQQAAGRVADALNHVARAVGTGDNVLPGGLELVAEALRGGLSDIASALREIAGAIRDSGYSG